MDLSQMTLQQVFIAIGLLGGIGSAVSYIWGYAYRNNKHSCDILRGNHDNRLG